MMDRMQRLTRLHQVISEIGPEEEFNIMLPWSCVKGHACQDRVLIREGLKRDNFPSFFGLTEEEFDNLYYPSSYDEDYGEPARQEALLVIEEILKNTVVLVVHQRSSWFRALPLLFLIVLL